MADPGLLAGLLAAVLAVAPPATAAPVPQDMSARPPPAAPEDMSQKPSESPAPLPDESGAASPRALPPGPTDGVPRASAAAPLDNPAEVPVPAPALVDPIPTAVEGPTPAPTPERPIPTGACHGSRPCKRLVILASVSGALGAASVIAGAVLAARPIIVDPDDPTMAITYRPAGTAVLTIGIGVLGTSLLMTLAAVRASRQARRASVALRPGLAF